MLTRMISEVNEKNYKNALNLLNTQLLSNPTVLADWHLKRKTDLAATQKETLLIYLQKLDIDISKLSSKVVHVAGTKGKGSTCAFTESIIRHHGYSTGLFTSPHLISVRERIKINGKLISEDMFTHYFYSCYDSLSPLWENNESMRPGYFKFLTILAIKVFEGENVDACVFEVGIGGRTDPTNIFDKPVCCGITTLDFDHMDVLGYTLGEIAYEKAGIIKPGVPIISVEQDLEAQKPIISKSISSEAPLFIASPWDLYSQGNNDILVLRGEFQKKNASIACALANFWIAEKTGKPIIKKGEVVNQNLTISSTFDDVKKCEVFSLTSNYVLGLKNCFWPGRAQIIEKENPNVKYFLDGAHTPISIHACLQWFETEMVNLTGKRILCFNCKSTKDHVLLLSCIQQHASNLPFDYIFFTPSRIMNYEQKKSDKSNILSYNFDLNIAGPIGEQIKYRNAYEKIMSDSEKNTTASLEVFEYVDHTLARIEEIAKQNPMTNVLVTGSLYVVGAFLECLEFNTDHKYQQEEEASSINK